MKSTQVTYDLGLVPSSYYCCRSRLLRNGIAVYQLCFFPHNFLEELSRETEKDLS